MLGYRRRENMTASLVNAAVFNTCIEEYESVYEPSLLRSAGERIHQHVRLSSSENNKEGMIEWRDGLSATGRTGDELIGSTIKRDDVTEYLEIW